MLLSRSCKISLIIVFLSIPSILPRPLLAYDNSATLSEMETRAFGQSTGGTEEERLANLEKKAYGRVRIGGMSERMSALQLFMGLPPRTESASSNNPASASPDSVQPGAETPHHPLEATLTTRQVKLEVGDDPRFGGLWTGTLASRIDPHVKVFCELHGSGRHFKGTMIWTSQVCGGCRRTIVGFFNTKDQACMMKDLYVEPLNSHNIAKFCKVERYAFGITRDAERLSGWFQAPECRDFGAVTLTRYRE
jgi:hypothetical protein